MPAEGVGVDGVGARGLRFDDLLILSSFFGVDCVQPFLEAIPVCRRSYKYGFENVEFVFRMLSLTHPAKLAYSRYVGVSLPVYAILQL